MSACWSELLPDEDHTLLLQACLLTGESAQRAWNAFIERVGDARRFFEENNTGLKSLLPFLEFSLARNRIETEPSFRTYARVALLREELRCEIYYRVLKEVLDALSASHVSYTLIRGAALSPWLYASATIRHNHAINVLVDDTQAADAADALLRIGLTSEGRTPGRRQMTYLHHSALPVIVHTRLLELPELDMASTFAGNSITRELVNQSVRTLDATGHAVQVLGSASCSGEHGNLRWVIDAWHLLTKAEDIDWNEFWYIARIHGIDVFCATALGYLASELRVQIPDLRAQEKHLTSDLTDAKHRYRLFTALSHASNSHLHVLKKLRYTPFLALRYLGFALFPPANYLKFRHGITGLRAQITWHLGRPKRVMSHLVRQMKGS